MKEVRIAIAGLGGRGRITYGRMLQQVEHAKLVAIADIKPDVLEETRKEFGLEKAQCYTSAEEMLAQPKLADLFMICTPDECHADQAVAALEKGYDLLLEKPIATNWENCQRVLDAARKSQRRVVVCHVLRFTPFYGKIKELLDAGAIGDIVTLSAMERVQYWHQAHSFVRGNWRNRASSAPMILAKSCHDMDMIRYLAGKKCLSVSSYGSLKHFRPENAPEGSALRCRECRIKENCIYNPYQFYPTNFVDGVAQWPANILSPVPNLENVLGALDEGPYGRCVYHCDNDVVDHQVVNMLFEDGVTATFTMTAFTATGGRVMDIMGTKGELRANLDDNKIRIMPFGGQETVIDVSKLSDDFSGHAGGDIRMVRDFVKAIYEGKNPEFDIAQSVESHFMALAAEKSREEMGKPVEL